MAPTTQAVTLRVVSPANTQRAVDCRGNIIMVDVAAVAQCALVHRCGQTVLAHDAADRFGFLDRRKQHPPLPNALSTSIFATYGGHPHVCALEMMLVKGCEEFANSPCSRDLRLSHDTAPPGIGWGRAPSMWRGSSRKQLKRQIGGNCTGSVNRLAFGGRAVIMCPRSMLKLSRSASPQGKQTSKEHRSCVDCHIMDRKRLGDLPTLSASVPTTRQMRTFGQVRP